MEIKTLNVVLLAVLLIAVAVQAGDHHKKSDLNQEKEKHDRKEEPKREHEKKSVCERERVQCGAGRECVEDENGEPTCQCRKECPPKSSPVCGSDGKTYDSHCELHRQACMEGIKIHVQSDGHCIETPTKVPQGKPVVCYQSDRDRLRQKMIDWMLSQEIPDGWLSEGKSYNEVLKNFFSKYDQTGDNKLDSNELLKLVEGNETVKEVVDEKEQELEKESENSILRGLCVDALIDIGDEDADWVLDLKEFENCMDPEYKPPHRMCSLEDEYFEDGAETKVKCNSCVCACGNWVCTAMTCDENDEAKVDSDESKEDDKEEMSDPALDFPDEMTEEEFQAYLQKLTESDGFADIGTAEKDVEDEEKEIEKEIEKEMEIEPVMQEKDLFEKEKQHESKKDDKYMSDEKF